MLCKNPYFIGAQPCECRKCLPCRIQRTKMWAQRILLETRSWSSSIFVTLTYMPSKLMDVSGAYVVTRDKIPTLVPEDAKNFLKRLRVNSGIKFRYFLVGEYGDRTQRPHIHMALFGFPECKAGRTNHLIKRCCSTCEVIERSWGNGGIDVGSITPQSAKYIAGYCQKKWKKEEECQPRKTMMGWSRPTHLKDGRRREFTRMSLKPGIGAIVIKNLSTGGEQSQRVKNVIQYLDAPVVLRNNGSLLPLGRYLRRKWREALGRKPDTPESVMGQYREELRTMLEKDEKEVPSGEIGVKQKARFHQWRKNKQKILGLESRAKIYRVVKTI